MRLSENLDENAQEENWRKGEGKLLK